MLIEQGHCTVRSCTMIVCYDLVHDLVLSCAMSQLFNFTLYVYCIFRTIDEERYILRLSPLDFLNVHVHLVHVSYVCYVPGCYLFNSAQPEDMSSTM